MKKTLEEVYILFEKYWKAAPVFPIPEEHSRHKIAAEAAYLSGFAEALQIMEKS